MQSKAEEIGAALQNVSKTRPLGPGAWSLALWAPPKPEIEVRLRHSWLIWRHEVLIASDWDAWSCVRSASSLPATCKVAMENDGALFRRLETPLDSGRSISEIARAAAGILTRADRTARGRVKKANVPAAQAADAPAISADFVKDACGEAGWPVTERDGGTLVVQLDGADGFRQVTIDASGESPFRLRVPIARFENLSEVSREALGLFILAAHRWLRFSRFAVEEAGDRTQVFAEVRFEAAPSPLDIDHALKALTTASDLCAAEIECLGGDEVAQKFVGVRGGTLRAKDSAA